MFIISRNNFIIVINNEQSFTVFIVVSRTVPASIIFVFQITMAIVGVVINNN